MEEKGTWNRRGRILCLGSNVVHVTVHVTRDLYPSMADTHGVVSCVTLVSVFTGARAPQQGLTGPKSQAAHK